MTRLLLQVVGPFPLSSAVALRSTQVSLVKAAPRGTITATTPAFLAVATVALHPVTNSLESVW